MPLESALTNYSGAGIERKHLLHKRKAVLYGGDRLLAAINKDGRSAGLKLDVSKQRTSSDPLDCLLT